MFKKININKSNIIYSTVHWFYFGLLIASSIANQVKVISLNYFKIKNLFFYESTILVHLH
jgi:hypothetical protein